MTVVEVLEKARGLVEKGWTQEASARRADGSITSIDDDLAVAWCLSGALHRAEGRYGGHEACRAIGNANDIDWNCMADWNDADGRTQADVLAALDRAIIIARRAVP